MPQQASTSHTYVWHRDDRSRIKRCCFGLRRFEIPTQTRKTIGSAAGCASVAAGAGFAAGCASVCGPAAECAPPGGAQVQWDLAHCCTNSHSARGWVTTVKSSCLIGGSGLLESSVDCSRAVFGSVAAGRAPEELSRRSLRFAFVQMVVKQHSDFLIRSRNFCRWIVQRARHKHAAWKGPWYPQGLILGATGRSRPAYSRSSQRLPLAPLLRSGTPSTNLRPLCPADRPHWRSNRNFETTRRYKHPMSCLCSP